jgi:energy-coupling factor transporter ATP-binding protein EcfA2
MRLKELTIAGFRGFRLSKTIPLDANVVVVHGPNGSGKSNIAEALEWLLLGEISRRKRARNPGEFVGEYLRNVHCGSKESTFVEACVVLDDRELTIRREYDGPRRPSRVFTDGNRVDDLSIVGIPIDWYTKPILSQGEMKGFVDTEQKDRYSEIAYILGLDVLGEFRQSLMDLKRNMDGNKTIRQAMGRRDVQIENLRQYDELDKLSDKMELLPYNHHAFLKELYLCIKRVSGVTVRSLNECRKALKTKEARIMRTSPELSKLRELAIPGSVIPTPELLGSLKQIVKICDQLKLIVAQRVEMRQARFLEIGFELISDSVCPFCLQQTITKDRKNEIRGQLRIYKKGLELENELRSSLDSFSGAWRKVFQDLCDRVEIQAGLKTAVDEAMKVLGRTPDTNALRKFHDEKLPKLQAQVYKINQEVQKLIQSCGNLLNHRPDLSIEKLIKLGSVIRPKIETICIKVYRDAGALATLKLRMLSSTPGMSPQMRQEISMILHLESLVEESEYIKLAGIYGNMSSGLEDLQSKVEEFERTRMKQMLGNLSNDISRYYDKLNPGEPIKFARLAMTTPVQRHVRIEGESFGKDLNPVSCFSEAHVNCLGLSLYFCQRIDRNPQWRCFVLDDPIQSMDEPHAECLVDVLREISQDKQLIVLTQQKRLCDVLDDVFQGQSYIKYTLGPYTQDGPQIEPEIESIERNLQLVKTFSRGSKDDRINKSAASLRKATEGIIKELLVAKCGVTRASLRTQKVKLSPRLSQLQNSGFDRDDIANIRTILPIIDQPHHDDPNWDVHPQKLKRAMAILETVCKKYKIGPYRIVRVLVGTVTNYLPKAGVAVVKVEQPFSVGDDLIIEGATTHIQMALESMELDRKKIAAAEPSVTVGIKVPDKVRSSDLVYKIV